MCSTNGCGANWFMKGNCPSTFSLSPKRIALFAVCGCLGPVSYTEQVPTPKGEETKDWRQVDVIHLNQIKRDYDIIGECRGDAWLDNVVSLKKQAARLGADAISLPKAD